MAPEIGRLQCDSCGAQRYVTDATTGAPCDQWWWARPCQGLMRRDLYFDKAMGQTGELLDSLRLAGFDLGEGT